MGPLSLDGGQISVLETDIASQIRIDRERIYGSLFRNVSRYIVVFSIILVVSYIGNLRLPRSFSNENAGNIPILSLWRKLFISFNGVSFLFSACGLLLCVSLTFSHIMLACTEGQINAQLKHLSKGLPQVVYVVTFLILSLTCCSAAYLFGGLATVGDTKSGRLPVATSSAIGIFVYLQALYIFLRDWFGFWSEVRLCDLQLWEVLKAETVFGRVWSWYVENMFERNSDTSVK